MDNQILSEIQQLKTLLARVLGLADRCVDEPWSEEALDKAAKEFLKLSTERGEWVKDDDVRKYIKSGPWNTASLIKKDFGFSNVYRHSHTWYYSKKDLIAFNEELEKRNINLSRYRELLEDKAAFEKSKHKIGAGKPYQIPANVKDITTTDIPKPDPEIVRQDLAQLKTDFKANQYELYIDVYKGIHAMLKNMYMYQKYLEPGLKRRCNKWCDDFNYANSALKAITGKPEKFIPPPDPTLIQL